MKRKLFFISSLSLLSILIILSIPLAFGWFIGGVNSPKVIITTAKIASKIDIFEGIDFDYDGYFDYSFNKDYYTVSYETSNEYGRYKYLDTVKDSDVGKKVNLNAISNMKPTDVLTYRFNIENKGDADAYVYLNGFKYEGNDLNFLKCLSVSICMYDPLQEDMEYEFRNKVYLANVISDSSQEYVIISSTIDDVIENYANNDSKYKRDVLIQVTFEKYDNLLDNVATNLITEEQYQQIQGYQFNKTIFNLILSTDKPIS